MKSVHTFSKENKKAMLTLESHEKKRMFWLSSHNSHATLVGQHLLERWQICVHIHFVHPQPQRHQNEDWAPLVPNMVNCLHHLQALHRANTVLVFHIMVGKVFVTF